MFYYSIGPLLDINDLQYVLESLNKAGFPQRKWKRLCLYLGLYDDTLEAIEAEYSGDEQGCLRQCLVKWLEGADGATGGGGPRISSLCEALERIGEKAAADYISKLLILIHCIYSYVVLHDTSFDNIIYVLSYYEVSFLYLFLVKNIINKDSPGIILLSLNKYIACIFTDIW